MDFHLACLFSIPAYLTLGGTLLRRLGHWRLILILSRTKTMSVWTTKTKGTRYTDVAFIESFVQPIRVGLGDCPILDCLCNACTHLSYMRSLDRRLNLGEIHAFI